MDNLDRVWVDKLIKDDMVKYMQRCLKQMFSKHGVEYTEQRIKEIYKSNTKLREAYLKQYRLMLQGQ